MDSVAATCRWIAAVRARESERSDRLFNDPYAQSLAGEEGFAFLERMLSESPDGPQGTNIAYIVHRTRFLDELVMEGVAAGIRQLVILAAGMDTRAFRLPLPADMQIFEADLPEVLSIKEKTLQAMGATPKGARKALELDLRAPWIGALEAAGFDKGKPAIWLVEGLLMYLEAPDVERLLRDIGTLAARGSRLGTDLINETFLQFRGTQKLRTYLQEIQAPWRWGTENPEAYFWSLGWRTQAVQPGELPYGRWALKTYPREREGISRMFFLRGER